MPYKGKHNMKKLLITAALAAAAVSSAFAGDVKVGDVTVDYGRPSVGARYSYSWESANWNMLGVTAGSKWDKIGVEGSFDRSTTGPSNVNKWGIVGSYDVYKLHGATIAAKVGAAYVTPSVSNAGWLGVVGFGVSYPLSANTSLTGDYSYQNGSSVVSDYNGNVVSFGIKYSF